MDDKYYTIAKPAHHEIKIKGSLFLAECGLVASIDEAMEILEAIRKREHAATHHCYAWRVGLFDQSTFKYSDDGEPSGTAGKPIYDVINGREIDNVIVVVTRYYGGTKLGTGGLVRAYSEAAIGAIDKAGKKMNYLTSQIKVEIDFSLYDKLSRLTGKLGAKQISSEYSDMVNLIIEIRQNLSDVLIEEIIQLSSGKAKIEKIS
ncbi:MAG: YigZ family protein [bacterium]